MIIYCDEAHLTIVLPLDWHLTKTGRSLKNPSWRFIIDIVKSNNDEVVEREAGVKLEPDVRRSGDGIFIFSSVLLKLEFVVWFETLELLLIMLRFGIFDNLITEVHKVIAWSFVWILRR